MKTRGSQEPVIAHLVFNLTSKFHIKISADPFFGQLKFLFNSNASHLGSKIISAKFLSRRF